MPFRAKRRTSIGVTGRRRSLTVAYDEDFVFSQSDSQSDSHPDNSRNLPGAIRRILQTRNLYLFTEQFFGDCWRDFQARAG
jgi:hypothetical protein